MGRVGNLNPVPALTLTFTPSDYIDSLERSPYIFPDHHISKEKGGALERGRNPLMQEGRSLSVQGMVSGSGQ